MQKIEELLKFTVWKTIDDFPSHEVSICGKVRNKTTKHILSPYIDKAKGNYLIIQVKNNNLKKSFFIHRLVASAFLPNIKNYNFISHKNKNKLDNNISNLIWTKESEYFLKEEKYKFEEHLNDNPSKKCIRFQCRRNNKKIDVIVSYVKISKEEAKQKLYEKVEKLFQ